MLIRTIQSAGVLLLIGASYLVAISGSSVPLTGDQKTYVSIAVEMRARAEWFIPYLFDRPNFLKPPFQYWTTLASWKLLGFHVFGTIFPSVVAMLLAAWLVRELSSDRSWLRALFFCSTVSVMTYGTTAQMEIWIVLAYLWCWHCFLRGRWALAWTGAGVMAWIKGPLYPALWAFGAGIHRFLARKDRDSLPRVTITELLWALAGTLVGLSWFLIAARAHGSEIMGVFFFRENLGKFSVKQGTPWGLWGEFFATLFPMLPWLLAGCLDPGVRARLRSEGRFWLAYALLPAMFFTLFPYRVNTYLFILVPLAVWMMEAGPVEWSTGAKGLLRGLVAPVGAVLLAILLRLYQGDWVSIALLSFFVSAIALWLYGHLCLRPEWIGVGALLMVTAVRLVGVELGERDLAPLRAAHAGGDSVAYALSGEDIWHEFGQMSVALGDRIELLRSGEERAAFLGRGGLLILNEEQTAFGAGLQCQEWLRMKRRLQLPLRELLLKGLSFQDPTLRRRFLLCRGTAS
jgi:4-amino-4-deoxy-L-arabinose transferase-like glycosyltransferase